jgi:acetylornithine/N-succinyldiaminopimelate aminotransferase
MAALRQNHLLVGTAGGNMLRLLPPLNISQADIDRGVDILAATVAEIAD